VEQQKLTTIYKANARAYLAQPTIRRALNEGGTSSTKTFSIIQLLDQIARHSKRDMIITISSESMPHLKRGCIRDFFSILGESPQLNPNYSQTEHLYDYTSKGVKRQLEFVAIDEPSKARGGRRQIYFLNEANNNSYEAFKEMDIRTELFTFLDWNPVSEFWAHEHLKGKPENAYIHSTYKDALWVLPQSVIDNIESNRESDPNWWNVYGLGLLGKVEGLVYPFFEQVETLPTGDYFYGLDFGYSNDPTTLIKNVIIGNSIFSEELIYETGLTNDAIAARMLEIGIRKNYDEIFADSAEPKSIQEIYQHGFNIKPCPKGADSVEFGHQKLRQYKQFWTQSSLNCIKEQRNFRYIADKDGKLTEKTTHFYSHGMDARRYGVVGKIGNPVGTVEDTGKGETAFGGVRKREF
jgi:phage terminase large subunit